MVNPKIDMMFDWMSKNRVFVYLCLYVLYSLYDGYLDFNNWRVKKLELGLLDTSFNMEELQKQNMASLMANARQMGG